MPDASFRRWTGSRRLRPFARWGARWGTVLAAALCTSKSHGAEPTIGGRWKAGPQNEDVTVREWLAACGPAPASRVQTGEDEFNVSSDLGELTFTASPNVAGSAALHSFGTIGCYESLPALSSDSHLFEPRTKTWRTRCATPVGDPRRIVVQSLVRLEGEREISLTETVHYEITVAEGKCVADVKRTRSFNMMTRSATPGAVPSGAAPPNEQVATDTTPTRPMHQVSSRGWFVAIVFGSAALLAVAWAYLARQKRISDRRAAVEAERLANERRQAREERVRAATGRTDRERAERKARERAHAGPMSCPTCKREFAFELSFCPYDANRLVPLNEARRNGPAGGLCPACKRGFNPGIARCPHDDEELVPYLRGVSEVDEDAPHGVICPTCSSKSDGKGTFCARDGTPLAPLN